MGHRMKEDTFSYDVTAVAPCFLLLRRAACFDGMVPAIEEEDEEEEEKV
jgi:hypothetical protein